MKGLLFRKQPRTDAGSRLFEIGIAIQTFASAYRTLVRRTWRDYFSVSSPFTHPRIGSRKGKREISFPSLRIQPFLLMVLASWKAERVLQAREIRRIGFSVIYRHDWRFTCESDECCPDRQQKQARKTSLLRFVSLLNWYGSKQELFNSYQHRKLTVSLNQRVFRLNFTKQGCYFSLAFSIWRWRFFNSVDKRNG